MSIATGYDQGDVRGCQAKDGTMKYKVKLQQSEEGFAVWCPGLPGCWSQGDTEQEAIDNIRDAIHEYLAAIAD
jgi:predicted RNase H-like HicB family nuclease